MATWHIPAPIPYLQTSQHTASLHPVSITARKLNNVAVGATLRHLDPAIQQLGQQRAVHRVTGHTVAVVTGMTGAEVAADGVSAVCVGVAGMMVKGIFAFINIYKVK